MAKFLGKTVTDEQVADLADHLSFENFKNNKAVNFDILKQLGIIVKDKEFVRKGRSNKTANTNYTGISRESRATESSY